MTVEIPYDYDFPQQQGGTTTGGADIKVLHEDSTGTLNVLTPTSVDSINYIITVDVNELGTFQAAVMAFSVPWVTSAGGIVSDYGNDVARTP